MKTCQNQKDQNSKELDLNEAEAVTGGKIIKNGATTPSGQPADAIEFYILFSDDRYAGDMYDRLYVHGYRYTGFVNDN